jgi:hypothetical protein
MIDVCSRSVLDRHANLNHVMARLAPPARISDNALSTSPHLTSTSRSHVVGLTCAHFSGRSWRSQYGYAGASRSDLGWLGSGLLDTGFVAFDAPSLTHHQYHNSGKCARAHSASPNAKVRPREEWSERSERPKWPGRTEFRTGKSIRLCRLCSMPKPTSKV